MQTPQVTPKYLGVFLKARCYAEKSDGKHCSNEVSFAVQGGKSPYFIDCSDLVYCGRHKDRRAEYKDCWKGETFVRVQMDVIEEVKEKEVIDVEDEEQEQEQEQNEEQEQNAEEQEKEQNAEEQEKEQEQDKEKDPDFVPEQ